MAESTIRINKACPRCFSATGVSLVLFEDKGNWLCPKNPKHIFIVGVDGFLQTAKTMW
jgi:hypothetical protein